MLARRPAGGHANLDFDLIEVMNGHTFGKTMKYRQLWFALLSQGRVFAGAASSDSHSLSDAQIGWPRNLVAAPAEEAALLAAIRAGRMMGTNGP